MMAIGEHFFLHQLETSGNNSNPEKENHSPNIFLGDQETNTNAKTDFHPPKLAFYP